MRPEGRHNSLRPGRRYQRHLLDEDAGTQTDFGRGLLRLERFQVPPMTHSISIFVLAMWEFEPRGCAQLLNRVPAKPAENVWRQPGPPLVGA